MAIYTLQATAGSGPSVADFSACLLAEAESCPLFTGDKPLRSLASKRGVIVRGHLWLLKELGEQGILNSTVLTATLQGMIAQGTRLPRDEVDKLLKSWSLA